MSTRTFTLQLDGTVSIDRFADAMEVWRQTLHDLSGVVGMARGAGESWSLSEHDDRSSDERPQLDEFVEIVTGWIIAGTTPPGSEAAGSQTPARASP